MQNVIEVQLGYQEKHFHHKCGQALEQATQRHGGINIPATVQEMCRCGAQGIWLVDNIGGGWTVGKLDQVILENFPNLTGSESVILRNILIG